jgi:hypothetical protein
MRPVDADDVDLSARSLAHRHPLPPLVSVQRL